MNYTIDYNSSEPIYKQIVKNIQDDIANGVFEDSKMLPNERQLSEGFKVSRGTIKKAFSELEALGKIRKIQGKGTFITGETMIEKREFIIDCMRKLIDDLVSLDLTKNQIKELFVRNLWLKLTKEERLNVAWIDCSEELLSQSSKQISNKCGLNVKTFLVEDVVNNPRSISQGFDFIITTTHHFDSIKSLISSEIKIEQIILSVSINTVKEIANIKNKDKVIIFYKSKSFLELVKESIKDINKIQPYKEIYIDKDPKSMMSLIENSENVIVPYDFYVQLKEEGDMEIEKTIVFEYMLDEGSIMHIQEQEIKRWILKYS